MRDNPNMERLPRQYDLDWLRVFVILFVFMFHVGIIFSVDDLGVHSDWRNGTLGQLLFFTSFLRMPVLFFIAGAGTWFLFRRRDVQQFFSERVRRLLIPFISALILIVPAMSYIGYRFQAEQAGERIPGFGEVFVQLITAMPHEWMHLWFIAYLLLFSLLAAPLFQYLKTERGQALLNRVLCALDWRWGVLLFAVPMILIEWSMQWRFVGDVPLVNDWADFTLYFYLFICGFILVGDPRFWEQVQRLLPVSVIATAGLFVTLPIARQQVDLTQSFPTHWDYSLIQVGMGLIGWTSLLAAVGLTRRFLSFENAALRYARDASYPFYLLHMLPLWAVAYVVVSLSMPYPIEFVLITGVSFVLTLAIYEVLVRRHPSTRFAFGLKPVSQDSHPARTPQDLVASRAGRHGSSG